MKFDLKKIDLIVISAVVAVNLIVLFAFFLLGDFSGQLEFRRIYNPETGEPLSIIASCIVYTFLSYVAYPLYCSVLTVGIVEPIVLINVAITKYPISSRFTALPGFDIGVSAVFRVSAVSAIIIGFCSIFGIVTF